MITPEQFKDRCFRHISIQRALQLKFPHSDVRYSRSPVDPNSFMIFVWAIPNQYSAPPPQLLSFPSSELHALAGIPEPPAPKPHTTLDGKTQLVGRPPRSSLQDFSNLYSRGMTTAQLIAAAKTNLRLGHSSAYRYLLKARIAGLLPYEFV